jgi:hypothetical protein
MLVINIQTEHFRDPATEDLGRSRLGYSSDMTPEEIYDAARGCWVLGARADREDTALVAHAGTVVLALAIDRIDPLPGSNRRVIAGRILGPGHPVHDRYVDNESPAGRPRNPIRYINPDGCRCGCGEPVDSRDFLPGHDQRAIHDRVSQVGTVREFCDWFDATFVPGCDVCGARAGQPCDNPYCYGSLGAEDSCAAAS